MQLVPLVRAYRSLCITLDIIVDKQRVRCVLITKWPPMDINLIFVKEQAVDFHFEFIFQHGLCQKSHILFIYSFTNDQNPAVNHKGINHFIGTFSSSLLFLLLFQYVASWVCKNIRMSQASRTNDYVGLCRVYVGEDDSIVTVDIQKTGSNNIPIGKRNDQFRLQCVSKTNNQTRNKTTTKTQHFFV